MDIIKSIEHEQLKHKIPELKVGNTVRVHQKIKEGNRERIQVFEGIIIKKQNGGVNETFTVRKISYGVGVEKTFLVHSPLVEKVEVVRVGKARRAKLFYLRDRVGKAAKTRENVLARIENEELTIKEDLAEEPAVEEVPAQEVTETAEAVAEAPVAEEVVAEEPVKEEKVAEEAPKAEVATEEVKEEAKVEEPKTESAPEEAPAVETEKPTVQETVDTVKEEKVEDVKEEPVDDKKAE